MSPLQRVACPLPHEELTDSPKTTSFIPTVRLESSNANVLTPSCTQPGGRGMSHITEPLWGFTLLYVAPMTTFLLIRHALCDPVGKAIAGRAAGIHLNQVG